MLMSSQDYRDSLRRSRPRVYVDGHVVESVADEPSLAPGVNALGLSYDYALRENLAPVMRTRAGTHEINRMNAIPASSQDLLNKLEAVRLLCRKPDARSGIWVATGWQRCARRRTVSTRTKAPNIRHVSMPISNASIRKT